MLKYQPPYDVNKTSWDFHQGLFVASCISNNIWRVTNQGFIYLVRSQKFPNNISFPLICTRTCAYQGVRNGTFLENFANDL